MATELTEPDIAPQLIGQFDTASKQIVRKNADECIQFCLGTTDAEAINVIETEQPVVKWYRADSFIHANVRGEEAIVHMEFQTHDSTEVPMPYRIAGYAGLGIRTYQLPIYSHVIYLHPNAGLNDPGEYVQNVPGYEIAIKYKVIRLCNIDGQNVLDAKLKGLIPFAPLMKPPEEMDADQWLRKCIEVAQTIPMDEADKPDYLAATVILSDVIFDFHDIYDILSEETMKKSSFAEYFTEKAERKNTIELLLDVLEVRFQPNNVQTLKPTLENIQEQQELKQLFLEAVQVSSFDEFKRILASNGAG
ncbi:hypothetical protein C6501_19805 [Candidatus Poribacteria bacterium]|nr:MAG: hypothetical protein C6501_19805 [Candidatus Poribacteria bacterium]